jgi:hypothetical protein
LAGLLNRLVLARSPAANAIAPRFFIFVCM